MRAIKSSLEQLLKRIDAEARHATDHEEDQKLAELRKEHAATIKEYVEAHDRLDRLEERLERAGLSMRDKTPHASQRLSNEIHARHEKHKRRFNVMRNNIIIRLGLADDAEKKFMLRNFFDEVAKVYPALQSVLGKIKS
jgi:exonuclease VII large subunit